ncbi:MULTISPECIES: outer membrane lipoprotein-sorting protein [Anaeromyxobacter]|uniref:outer membrane lipoprotein-sorting protein n=1 Tax=Anaeromyxobacter TaxID=161492 RepID=UPI001F566779|nr:MULTISPECIES: outer membrane lipoprotein-sorting protein [unclassified Anaeromyxobacter]
MHRALAFLALAAALAAGPAAALTPQELAKVVATIDERQRNSGDWKALCYMEAKEKGKTDVVYELVVYRRDEDDKQMFLFTKPRAEAGKGYLRIDKNLWLYDPAVGRWERRTERERIGGTDTRRGDLDESRLVEEYDAKFEADEKLGVYGVHRILLVAKPGVDVAFPQVRLWVDQATLNVLKRQELALSGRLMRTAYYPRWKKVFSPSKGADVWYPEEMRLFDEIEKGNSTLILIKEIDLRPLAANLFTKAWLESKSR